QRSGQPAAWNFKSAQGTPQDVGSITSIIFVGNMAVWDIEVGGDHSYKAGGFINHNSTQVNLQQVPKRDKVWGPKIRSLFVADKHHLFFRGDLAQQEPRLLLHFAFLCGLAGAAQAVETFRKDPFTDYHRYTLDICNANSSRHFIR